MLLTQEEGEVGCGVRFLRRSECGHCCPQGTRLELNRLTPRRSHNMFNSRTVVSTLLTLMVVFTAPAQPADPFKPRFDDCTL